MHEFHDLLQVALATAKVRLSHGHLALSTSAASHLPQQRWSDKVSAHSCIMKNNPPRGTDAGM